MWPTPWIIPWERRAHAWVQQWMDVEVLGRIITETCLKKWRSQGKVKVVKHEPGSTNIAGWKWTQLEDVNFLLKMVDIPASYVSLPEGNMKMWKGWWWWRICSVVGPGFWYEMCWKETDIVLHFRKTKISPEMMPYQKENSLPSIIFQGTC